MRIKTWNGLLQRHSARFQPTDSAAVGPSTFRLKLERELTFDFMADAVHIQPPRFDPAAGFQPLAPLDIAHIVLSSDSLAASLSHSNEKEPVEFTFPSVYKA